MTKPKYKSAATSRRFKSLGQGLYRSEDRIQERARTELDGIKLAKLQQEEVSKNFISGLQTSHKFEEGVLLEKQKLENEARKNKFEAFKKFAETSVEKLQGEYKLAEKSAKFWEAFAPQFAKDMGKLAEGGLHFLDRYRGQKQIESLYASGILDQLTDQQEAANFSVVKNANADGWKLDPEAANTLHDKTFRASTVYASKALATWYKENKELIRTDAIKSYEAIGGEKYGEHNALEVQKFNAMMLMEKAGISAVSEGGKTILETASSIGVQDRNNFIKVRRVGETETRIEDQLKTINGLAFDVDDEKSMETYRTNIHQLAQIVKNGYFKDSNGKIRTPYDSPYSVADSMDQALKYLIDKDIKTLTRDKLERILAFDIPDTGTGEKTPYSKKHAVRSEAILDYFDKKKTELESRAEDAIKANSVNSYSSFEKEFNEQAWKEEGKDYERWRLEKINWIMDNPDFTDKHRNAALAKLSYNWKDHEEAKVYANIELAIMDGDMDRAMDWLSTVTDLKDREKLLSKITGLKELTELGPIGQTGVTGFAGVSKQNLNKYNATQTWIPTAFKQRGLSDSAVRSHQEMDEVWIAKYLENRKTMSVKDAYDAANLYIETEWKEGETNPDSLFYRKPSDLKGNDQRMVFPRHQDHDVNLLNDWNNRDTISENEADKYDWDTLESDQVETIIRKDPSLLSNYNEHKDILRHPRFINGKELKSFAKQLKAIDRHEIDITTKVYGQKRNQAAGFDIPPQVITFSRLTGMPVIEIMRGLVKNNEKKYDFLEGVSDLLSDDSEVFGSLNHGGKKVGNIRIINNSSLVGSNAYYSIKNQRIVPTRKEVRYAIDNNLTVNQAFSRKTGITWTKDADGNYSFTDTEGYIRNGGLNLPSDLTPTQLIQGMNLRLSNTFIKDFEKKKRKILTENDYTTP